MSTSFKFYQLADRLVAMFLLVDNGSGPRSCSATELGGPAEECWRPSHSCHYPVRWPSSAGVHLTYHCWFWVQEVESPWCAWYIAASTAFYVTKRIVQFKNNPLWFISADPPIGDRTLSAPTRTEMAIQKGEGASVVCNLWEILILFPFIGLSLDWFSIFTTASEPEASCKELAVSLGQARLRLLR